MRNDYQRNRRDFEQSNFDRGSNDDYGRNEGDG